MHGPPAMAPTLQIRATGSTRWLVLTYAVCFAGLLAYSVFLFVQPDATNVGWGIAAATLLAIGTGFAGNAAVAAFRPIRIADGELRLARMFSTRRIPVADIAGVGLLFRDPAPGTRQVSGWYPYVWRSDRIVVALGSGGYAPKRMVQTGDRSATRRIVAVKGSIDALASTDMGALAASGVGNTVTRVHAFVLASQGPAGPLARHEFQPAPTSPADAHRVFTAYWSPTGEFGRY